MLLILPMLLACSGDETPTEDTSTAASTLTADTAEAIDTGWSPGDFAQFMVWTDGLNTAAGAVAVQTTPGFANLAECLTDPANDTTCLPQIPKAEGTFIDFDPDARIDKDLLRTRWLGTEVAFGPFPVQTFQDEGSQAVFYRGSANFDAIEDLEIGPKWGADGAWPAYEGLNDIFVTEAIEVISPAPGSFNRFTSGSQLVFEWVPRGDGSGIITLEVTSRFGFSRIYRLADDGLFALDVDTLPWGSLIQDCEFKISRWDRSEIRKFGHVIEFVAKSSAEFTGQYLNVGPREPLQPSNTCQPADGLLSLPEGGWWWPMDGLTNNISGCGSGGPDAIYRVDLPPRTLLTLDYTAYGEDTDAVIGISTQCPAQGDSCEELINQFNPGTLPDGFNAAEFAEYFNITDRTETVYIFADTCSDPFLCPFLPEPVFLTLDVQIEELQAPELYNTCGDVPQGVSLGPGVYYSQFTAFSGSLNPGAGGCTNKSAPGADALVPITVPPGATLTLGIEMPGADPSIYLLTNCNDAFTCVAGSDTGADEDEDLSYTNQTQAPENLFLVIDSANGLQPYFLSVNFN